MKKKEKSSSCFRRLKTNQEPSFTCCTVYIFTETYVKRIVQFVSFQTGTKLKVIIDLKRGGEHFISKLLKSGHRAHF